MNKKINEISREYNIPCSLIQNYLFDNSRQRFLYNLTPYIPGTIREKRGIKHEIINKIDTIKRGE